MSKISKKIAVFIIFLILIILWGVIKMPMDTKNPVNKPLVGTLFVEFENGTTEPGVQSILENCNIPINYSIEYDSEIMSKRYYIIVDPDKRNIIRKELRKEKNWTDPIFPDFKKGNYYVITVTKQAIEDESFLDIIEKNNLHVKNSILCLIRFVDGSTNSSEKRSWISESDATRIKNELEMNVKVLTVGIGYIDG